MTDAMLEQRSLALEQKGLSLVDNAKDLTIVSTPTYEAACAMLLDAKAGLKACDEAFDGDIARWHDGHKQALANKSKYAAPFRTIETILKPKISSYHHAQEQTRLEQQRALQEQAQLQEAVDAEARGDQRGADDALNGRGVVSVTLPPATPKVNGVSMRENWTCEITDLLELVKAVANGKVPLAAISPNEAFLRGQARALKQELRYPGVRVVNIPNVAAGRSTMTSIR